MNNLLVRLRFELETISTSLGKAVLTMAQYNADESCGKCTPCREGTPRLVNLATKILSSEATNSEKKEAKPLAKLINATSLCGLGQAAGNPILSLMHFFNKEDSQMHESQS